MSYTAKLHALRVLRQHLDALAIAALAGDRLCTQLTKRRLRLAARLACDAADHGDGSAPTELEDAEEDLEAPHLVGLQACRADLHESSWVALRAVLCDLETANLRRTILDNAWLTRCNLAHADLTNTSWRHARLSGCSFAGAKLVDVALDGAHFEDCDLRGADISMISRGALSRALPRFVRCDLRGSRWTAASIDAATLVECWSSDARSPWGCERSSDSRRGIQPDDTARRRCVP